MPYTIEYTHVHESSNPKLSVNQKIDTSRAWSKANYHSRHQVSNNNEVADRHAKALDRNRSIEYDGEIRICELR